MKSILKPLTVAEMKSEGGSKITKLGAKKRRVVVRLLASAHQRGQSTVESVAKRLKKEVGGDRNWKTVAITELTDAKGKASLAVIQQVFGVGARVFRRPGKSCCQKCRSLFGSASPKFFQADKIDPTIVGAVHPNCVCGPWQSAERPDMTKSMDPKAEIPMGIVRREWDPKIKNFYAVVSTGNGYWTRLDSPTGRAVVQSIAMCVPLVKIREKKNETVFVHGAVKTREPKIELYDLRKFGGARFYQMDHGDADDLETRTNKMSKVRDVNDYLTHLKTVMPSVATMPEYWHETNMRWLSDFFGFKTLTDWVVVVSGKINPANKIRTVSLNSIGQKKAIRQATYAGLEGAWLRKCSY